MGPGLESGIFRSAWKSRSKAAQDGDVTTGYLDLERAVVNPGHGGYKLQATSTPVSHLAPSNCLPLCSECLPPNAGAVSGTRRRRLRPNGQAEGVSRSNRLWSRDQVQPSMSRRRGCETMHPPKLLQLLQPLSSWSLQILGRHKCQTIWSSYNMRVEWLSVHACTTRSQAGPPAQDCRMQRSRANDSCVSRERLG